MPCRFSPEALEAERRRARLSREAVAIAIGRSWASLYAYERGRVVPPTETLARLADVLGCELGNLFVEETESAEVPS